MMMSENNHISLGTKVYFATIGDFTGIATTPAPAQPTQNELVEMIHSEFDTAADRLLAEAQTLLKTPIKSPKYVPLDPELVAKAERLKKLGFTNSAENQAIVDHQLLIAKNNEDLKVQKIERELKAGTVQLIKHYQKNYPFSKFLTVFELNRICEKYGLISAPVSAYIKEVPDKNLAEIENAQALDIWDYPADSLEYDRILGGTRSVNKAIDSALIEYGAPPFYGKTINELLEYLNTYNKPAVKKAETRPDLRDLTPNELRNYERLTRKEANDLQRIAISRHAADKWFMPDFSRENAAMENRGMSDLFLRDRWTDLINTIPQAPSRSIMDAMKDYSVAILGARTASQDVSPIRYRLADICGFFIAAPLDHFNLDPSKYQKTSKYGYQVKNDPIVFRYCRGGILVDSKWGLEASDPALLNPINN